MSIKYFRAYTNNQIYSFNIFTVNNKSDVTVPELARRYHSPPAPKGGPCSNHQDIGKGESRGGDLDLLG